MPKVKTITLSGGETAVKFEKSYPYYFVSNMGDSEICVSGNPSINAYADGVYTIPPGTETRISPERLDGTIYLLGSGTVQIRAEEIAVPTSFRAVLKGGEISGAGLEIKIVDELPESGDSKYLYLVPKSDLLSDNIYNEYIWVNGAWEKIGTTEINPITDYSDLTNKPSIEGNVLDGNKTLEQLGINNFDGKYANLNGTPMQWAYAKRIVNSSVGWKPLLKITNASVSYELLVMVSIIDGAASVNFSGIISVHNCTRAKFTLLSGSGVNNDITQIKIKTNQSTGTMAVEIYHAVSTYKYGYATVFYNPNSLPSNHQITFFDSTMTSHNEDIFDIDIDHPISYDDLRDKPVIDTALSDTSTNPVQNNVITEAINALSDRISQLEEQKE